jgi:FMN-dependent NADH-azoreductase
MQILRIDTATTGDNSVSRELTDAIAAHFRAKYPDATWVEHDFATNPLPHLDRAKTGAIRQPQDTHDDAMKAAFAGERAVFDEFIASDLVIIGAPMYNFGIPSSLKAWIDRLGVPGHSFGYSEKGPVGLAGGRRVIVASSRGGQYELGGAAEHQETYLRDFFGFIGIRDVEFIRAEKIGFGPEARAAAIAAAQEEIAKL